MLKADDLERMREDYEESLPDTIVLLAEGWESDGGGGGTATWSAAGTVPCRIVPVASSGEGERVEGGRVQPDTEFVVSCPWDTPIDDSQRVEFDSQVFTVTSAGAPRSWSIGRRFEVKEVR